MTEGIFDQDLGVMRYDMTKSTVPAQSLKDQTKAKAAPDNSILKGIMALSGTAPARLEPEQVRFLQAALRQHIGDGVPDGTSTKSANSLKDAQKSKDMPTLKKNLAAMKESIKESTGLKPEMQEALFAACERTVQQHIVEQLATMISDEPWFAMLAHEGNHQFTACEILAERIEGLEEALAFCAEENRDLLEARQRRHAAKLHEDMMYPMQQKAARQRRSSLRLSQDLYEANPDNIALNESHQEHLEPNMARYLRSLQSSTSADSHQVDTKSAGYLTETFEVTK